MELLYLYVMVEFLWWKISVVRNFCGCRRNLNTWPGKNYLVADRPQITQIGRRSLKNHWGKPLIGRRSLATASATASTPASAIANTLDISRMENK